jgi:hypothetical protein
MKRFVMMSFAVLAAACTINACSSATETNLLPCDPDAILPSSACLKQTSSTEDAGTDGETDAGTDASNIIDNNGPGLDISNWAPPNGCNTGRCIPDPVGEDGALWATVPVSLWIGPLDQVLNKKCGDDETSGVPKEVFRRYDQLVAPPATCSSCSCTPSEGTCSGVPETLELRAGTCAQSGVVTIPFDAPANWDGSCTNADTIAAGAKCPAGSQTLCTQSVHSSVLPSPADDACKPSVSAPLSTLQTTWELGALACTANAEAPTCGTDALKSHCVNDPGSPWLQCTYRTGVHEKCPENYQSSRHVLYPKEPIDNRGCSACSCGAPMGSACKGALSLSTDDACGAELVKLQVGSIGPMCYDFLLPGEAIGSKAIVNRTYLSGVCAVSGGDAIGAAMPNDNELGGVVTFCCRAPEPPPPPPDPPAR